MTPDRFVRKISVHETYSGLPIDYSIVSAVTDLVIPDRIVSRLVENACSHLFNYSLIDNEGTLGRLTGEQAEMPALHAFYRRFGRINKLTGNEFGQYLFALGVELSLIDPILGLLVPDSAYSVASALYGGYSCTAVVERFPYPQDTIRVPAIVVSTAAY